MVEIVCAGCAVIACFFLAQRLRKMHQASARLEEKMRSLQIEAADWKQRACAPIQALTREIDTQLSRWQLSPAEKEITLLLLKGLNNKEIACARKTSQHTIKQQTSAIYRKSGLKTRSEMSAFFLGDLLPAPAEPAANSL